MTSDDIVCERPRWKFLRFRHQVHCRVPQVVVNHFQQTKLNALLTCTSASILWNMVFDRDSDPAFPFENCMLEEQGFVLTMAHKEKKVHYWYHWRERLNNPPRSIMYQEAYVAFEIFKVMEIAAGLGGVRLGSKGNTLAPGQTVAEAWRSFNHSVVPSKYVPSMDCEPSVLTRNIFVGVFREVLALTVGFKAAMIATPIVTPLMVASYVNMSLFGYGSWKNPLDWVFMAATLPIVVAVSMVGFAANVVSTSYSYLAQPGLACSPVVALGSGGDPPVCVAAFFGERWKRIIKCPNGVRGWAECRNGTTTVRCTNDVE